MCGWLILGWLLLRWLLFGWMILGWLFLRWLLLGWLLLTLSLNKTPLGETGCLGNPLFLFTGCLGIQFFDLPPFSQQSITLPLVTYPLLCSTSVTCKMTCLSIGHQVLPTQPLAREAGNFPRGSKHSTHVPLLTYLAWLQLVINNPRLII